MILNDTDRNHRIEHIDEPGKYPSAGSGFLFDLRGRQLKGWTNKLIYGDNKLIQSESNSQPRRFDFAQRPGLYSNKSKIISGFYWPKIKSS